MPEVGLALGRSRSLVGGIEREILSWFDEQGDRYLSAEEQARAAQAEAKAERQSRLSAVQQLSRMGLSTNQISEALGLSEDIVNQQLES